MGCRDIEKWCMTCDTCACRKQPQRKAKGPLQLYQVGQIMERIAIDIQGPYPVSNRQKELFSDRGSNFESELFKEMCDLLGIHKTRTTVGRPSSDGLVERINRVIQNMLSAFVQKDQRDWCTHLPLLVMAYNSSLHSSTGFTPSLMMFGREMNLPIDLALGKPVNEKSHFTTTYVLELEDTLTEIHDIARTNLGNSAVNMKTNYDKGKFHTNYEIGEPYQSPKLQNYWTGPYIVTKKWGDVLYGIQLKQSSPRLVVHHDKLKHYRDDDYANWLQA
ncbi:POL4-like protein [Mya arenaria]|uniref:POL4-like protein n=1 Tax=Mya arenaria TaxID=6604 RepID=A0ABY7DGU9_MYAAR|nr:POL4-like protein [Mya arenaria]